MPSSLTFALAREPHAPALARARAADFLAGLPPRAQDDVELALSELVTNAVRHGDGRAVVALHRHADHVRLEVTDEGGGTPAVRSEPSEDGGWGLRLIEAIARRWGANDGVWCEIAF